LAEVLSNLAGNGIEYHTPNTPVIVEVTMKGAHSRPTSVHLRRDHTATFTMRLSRVT
jgi:hypothetical protein